MKNSWYNLGQRVGDLEEGIVEVTVEDISDASVVGKSLLKATDATEARTAIGAGTSNLALGTTASTASMGTHNHATVAHTASGLVAYTTLQLAFQGLSARIKALEDATV